MRIVHHYNHSSYAGVGGFASGALVGGMVGGAFARPTSTTTVINATNGAYTPATRIIPSSVQYNNSNSDAMLLTIVLVLLAVVIITLIVFYVTRGSPINETVMIVP